MAPVGVGKPGVPPPSTKVVTIEPFRFDPTLVRTLQYQAVTAQQAKERGLQQPRTDRGVPLTSSMLTRALQTRRKEMRAKAKNRWRPTDFLFKVPECDESLQGVAKAEESFQAMRAKQALSKKAASAASPPAAWAKTVSTKGMMVASKTGQLNFPGVAVNLKDCMAIERMPDDPMSCVLVMPTGRLTILSKSLVAPRLNEIRQTLRGEKGDTDGGGGDPGGAPTAEAEAEQRKRRATPAPQELARIRAEAEAEEAREAAEEAEAARKAKEVAASKRRHTPFPEELMRIQRAQAAAERRGVDISSLSEAEEAALLAAQDGQSNERMGGEDEGGDMDDLEEALSGTTRQDRVAAAIAAASKLESDDEDPESDGQQAEDPESDDQMADTHAARLAAVIAAANAADEESDDDDEDLAE